MNNKKNMNNGIGPSGDDVPLSAAEYELYRQLLSISYPQPKKSIKDGVMEQLKAEKTAGSPLICAFDGKESAVKKNRTRRMNRFVRYGSIAACFVLIIGVIIGIVPILDGMAKTENASMAADLTADCASYENTMATYAATDAAPVTGVAEETAKPENWKEAAKSASSGYRAPVGMYDIAPQSNGVNTAEACTEAYAETEAEDGAENEDIYLEEEAEPAETAPETAADEYGTAETAVLANSTTYAETDDSVKTQAAAVFTDHAAPLCGIHGDILHTFSDELIEYVGEEAFSAWYYSEESADECGMPSVTTFVVYFGIDRELFAELTAESEISYDTDAVYPSAVMYTLR